MSTPPPSLKAASGRNKRSVKTDGPRRGSLNKGEQEETASPTLRSRKRKNSGEEKGPPSKRMADNEIMAAISDICKSMVSMEKQLKNCCTKEYMMRMTKEIRSEVQNNTQRIDKLFDLRKNDSVALNKTVERIVGQSLAARRGQSKGDLDLTATEEAHQEAFLLSRRSVRLWPIPQGLDLEDQIRTFFYTILNILQEISKSIRIQTVQRLVQPRRSKIVNEVLVRFHSAHDRDTVQSYAVNLAGIDGKAGLRIDVPDHLRGIFRHFEAHAAMLKQRFGSVKRSIKFDDTCQNFCMDVKLDTTAWHRIDHNEVRQAAARSKEAMTKMSSGESEDKAAEKKKILLQTDEAADPVIIESDDDAQSE